MIQFNVDSNGVATLIFDKKDSKVNTLSMDLMQEFSTVLQRINNDTSIKVLVIKSVKPGVFIAGADIKEIQSISSYDETKKLVEQGQAILNQLTQLSCPTVSVIDGVCLGGGLELALACDFRMASNSDKTQLGLPEVNLGIIPGFGGTQRLPRLIGLQKALSMILTGKAVNAVKAKSYGLVDVCYPVSFEQLYIDQFLQQVMSPPKRMKLKKKQRLALPVALMDGWFLTRYVIYRMAKKTVLSKSKGHYPAPLAALKSAVSGRGRSLQSGLRLEAELFADCWQTSISSSLISLFFSQEAQKKLVSSKADTLQLKQAAVVGAGLMGSGIAWAFSYRAISTVLYDLNETVLQQGITSIDSIYQGYVKRRRLKRFEKSNVMHRITPCLDKQSLCHSNIVVEAVVEDTAIKQQVYQDLETIVSDDCIIATNTSSLSITELGSVLRAPDRFIGMHFFSPVHKMPLVEVIKTSKTSQKTLDTVLKLVKTFKKTPVVVKDQPGFLVNRILLPYVNEALYCLQDGAKVRQIDTVLEQFGMPVGPLTLSDNVGLDIGVKVLTVLQSAYGERMQIPAYVLNLFHEKKLLGKKTKCGFYDYRKKKKTVNQQVYEDLRLFQTDNGYTLTDEHIIERCLFIMVNEAFRCLDEGAVADVRQLDLAMIMGTGFPPFRGGLIAYAQAIGLTQIVERLQFYERLSGLRFKPCQYLLDCAEKKRSLIN